MPNLKAFYLFLLLAVFGLAVLNFSATAAAQSPALFFDEGSDGAWVRNAEIVRLMSSVPHLVRYDRVQLIQGYEFSTLLSKNSPDAWYSSEFDKSPAQIQNDRKIYGALDDQMAHAFNHLLTHDEIATQLERFGVETKPTDWMSPTTYELNDPYVDGVVTFTVQSVCVKRHQIVPTYNQLAPGVLAIPRCSGGRVYSVIKVARVRYNPFCDGVPCQSADEIKDAVQVVPMLTTVITH